MRRALFRHDVQSLAGRTASPTAWLLFSVATATGLCSGTAPWTAQAVRMRRQRATNRVVKDILGLKCEYKIETGVENAWEFAANVGSDWVLELECAGSPGLGSFYTIAPHNFRALWAEGGAYHESENETYHWYCQPEKTRTDTTLNAPKNNRHVQAWKRIAAMSSWPSRDLIHNMMRVLDSKWSVYYPGIHFWCTIEGFEVAIIEVSPLLLSRTLFVVTCKIKLCWITCTCKIG